MWNDFGFFILDNLAVVFLHAAVWTYRYGLALSRRLLITPH